MRERWTADLVDLGEPARLTQAFLHRPEEGSIGDCFRTAVASLLRERRPEDVPHFVELTMGATRNPGYAQLAIARCWLRHTYDLDMMAVALDAAIGYGVPYILSVHSKSGPWKHVVIARGADVIHDPSGVGGYTLADVSDRDLAVADVICRRYEPGPAEMLREWGALDPDEVDA